jgi:hypothetical protein
MREAIKASTEALGEMGRRGAALVAERHRASIEIPRLERLLSQAARRASVTGDTDGPAATRGAMPWL